MIQFMTGNLLHADTEALVNPVNCEGVMGAGLALHMKQKFPENFEAYRQACRRSEVQPGQMFVFQTGSLANPKYIVNFPTKRKWRENSRIEDIESGLGALVSALLQFGVSSVAIPPLGCGLGRLSWHDVRPLIVDRFQAYPELNVLIFEPL